MAAGASLPRSTLYPSLQDHEIVTKYPSVKGMAKNVFFLDHRHPDEGGGDESVSKTNPYEVISKATELSIFLTIIIA